jgi:hypothetical protein
VVAGGGGAELFVESALDVTGIDLETLGHRGNVEVPESAVNGRSGWS